MDAWINEHRMLLCRAPPLLSSLPSPLLSWYKGRTWTVKHGARAETVCILISPICFSISGDDRGRSGEWKAAASSEYQKHLNIHNSPTHYWPILIWNLSVCKGCARVLLLACMFVCVRVLLICGYMDFCVCVRVCLRACMHVCVYCLVLCI